ncbi:MAG: class I SAM-dependent methyltransferase, partial [Rhizobium pusense]|nr:class I SAM-dependent methyltransferase [Agrobacterium pusense]
MTVFPDQAAIDYDTRIENLVPGYALALEIFGCALAGEIDPRGAILVPGCGTGSEILALAHAFPEARFTAVEPSRAMLEKARNRLSQ